MTRRLIDFHIQVAVDEDVMRDVEDHDSNAWPSLAGCLATALQTIAEDNLDPDWHPTVIVGVGPTRIEYPR